MQRESLETRRSTDRWKLRRSALSVMLCLPHPCTSNRNRRIVIFWCYVFGRLRLVKSSIYSKVCMIYKIMNDIGLTLKLRATYYLQQQQVPSQLSLCICSHPAAAATTALSKSVTRSGVLTARRFLAVVVVFILNEADCAAVYQKSQTFFVRSAYPCFTC